MYDLTTDYTPKGDQITAIPQIVNNFNYTNAQTLLGVTGSGKTFTMANVIKELNLPTLILAPNKTLTYQLYNEMKEYFPNSNVSYYVSHFDYYLPESFNSVTNTYREKDTLVNEELKKIRLETTYNLLKDEPNTIVVSSISAIYGAGNPLDFKKSIIDISVGDTIPFNSVLYSISSNLYSREHTNKKGTFSVIGDTIIIRPLYLDYNIRITFWGDDVESIEYVTSNNKRIKSVNTIKIFPNGIVTNPQTLPTIITNIETELAKQLQYFKTNNLIEEHDRLKERTNYDISMLQELGWVSGIENYSMYFDGRVHGERPKCLLDFFPNEFLTIIDESHLFIPQLNTMAKSSYSTKMNLVKHGFRLPSALESRPLNFNEFFDVVDKILFVSATPSEFELQKSNGLIVEQVIRPTFIPDPINLIVSKDNQVDDCLDRMNAVINNGGQIILNTLTKKMSENLTQYLINLDYNVRYLHGDINALDRITLITDFKEQNFDVIIGVNLLREGLDFPNVQLVCVFDADMEGFLRNKNSLIQLAGRAARNTNSTVILYADKITQSIDEFINESKRRRTKQLNYNSKHNIEPTNKVVTKPIKTVDIVNIPTNNDVAITVSYAKDMMNKMAKEQDFISAAYWRDIYLQLLQTGKQ